MEEQGMGEQNVRVYLRYHTPSFTKGKAISTTVDIHSETAGDGSCNFSYDKEHKTVYMKCKLPGIWRKHIVSKHI